MSRSKVYIVKASVELTGTVGAGKGIKNGLQNIDNR